MSLLSFLSGKKTNIIGGAIAAKVLLTAVVGYGTGTMTLIDAGTFLWSNSDTILQGLGLVALRASVAKANVG